MRWRKMFSSPNFKHIEGRNICFVTATNNGWWCFFVTIIISFSHQNFIWRLFFKHMGWRNMSLSLRKIIGDDIFRHHSPIHSPSKISSGAHFSNTLGDEICFCHPISSTFHEKNIYFVTIEANLMTKKVITLYHNFEWWHSLSP